MKGPAAVVPQRAFLFARRARAVSPYKITRGRILYLVNPEAFGLSRRNPQIGRALRRGSRTGACALCMRKFRALAQARGDDARNALKILSALKYCLAIWVYIRIGRLLHGSGGGNGRRERFENFWRFEAGIDLPFLKAGKGQGGKE